MQLHTITQFLESWAPLSYQEGYDNAGLIFGAYDQEIHQALVTLDVTEAIVDEAISTKCNLIIAHHPIVFKPIKKLQPTSDEQRALIKAIQHNIALYDIHTNLDNVHNGVNAVIAQKLQLVNARILSPKPNLLQKLVVFCPATHTETVKNALFQAGAGSIGNYDQCSFQTSGTGNFRPNQAAKPFSGKADERQYANEDRLEVLVPTHLQAKIVQAMHLAHPYEEVAYDLIPLSNLHPLVGSGLIGELPQAVDELTLLQRIKEVFQVPVVRHTRLLNKPIQKVALCGGSGSFLISDAKRAGADFYLSADIKYHEFFQAESSLVIADIGHYETESPIKQQICDELTKKFPTFAVRISQINTNPINYS